MEIRKLPSTSTLGYQDNVSEQFSFSCYSTDVADRENDEIVPQRLPIKTADMPTYETPDLTKRKPRLRQEYTQFLIDFYELQKILFLASSRIGESIQKPARYESGGIYQTGR